jgi:subtilisin family serine protease
MDPASVPPRGRFRGAVVSFVSATTLLAGLTLGSAPATIAAGLSRAASQEAVPGQLVVGFEDGVSASRQRRAILDAGGGVEQRVRSIDAAVVVAQRGQTTDDLASELVTAHSVAFVEPNYMVHTAKTPNDAGFGKLWGLRNTGQFGGNEGADTSALAAWDISTGGDVIVAVTDTGIDYRHPDLDGNVWSNPADVANGLDDDGNGFVDDIHGIDLAYGDSDPLDDSGHGSHVAGIIGAEGNNLIGSVGVNWSVRLMGLKFLDKNGDGNTADAAAAIDYAVDEGAKVINASWGGPAFSNTLYAAVSRAAARGVIFVAASGNEGVDSDASPDYPAAFDLPNVISVAATDPADRLLDFSNFGRRSVDLAAPGDQVYSTVPTKINSTGYASYSGTSMAAPYVSGAAALYWSHAPASSSEQVRNALLQSVDPLPSLAGNTVTGGRLNLAKALGSAASTPQAQPSAGAPRDTTPPSPFRLLRPRDRYRAPRKGIRFTWQRSRDDSGIRSYKLYVDGKKRKTIRDKDGPGGHDPHTSIRFKLSNGRHRWFVRAFDYAGNHRTSKSSRRSGASRRSVFFVKTR